jgi:ankyrin repeat protein
MIMEELRAKFIKAAVWHGTLDEAQAILSAHPAIAGDDIYTAALVGDDARVCDFIARDPASVTAKGAPLEWDALTHLCFSKYLRLDRSRSDGFVSAARALLDAGADANTGFFDATHQPKPEWESALYGAAGVAHHAGLTRLLIEHGADPNDEEVPYHSPETYDNGAIKVLLESGKLTDDSLAMMLLRKADWHDYHGMKLLLEQGANPNSMTRWGYTALHQALRRDNHLDNIELLLDHDADPAQPSRVEGLSAISLAAWRGRGDVLELLEKRGVPIALKGLERLIAACARADADTVRSIAADDPKLVSELALKGGVALAQFAGGGNTSGIAWLLDLGIDVDARFVEGDGYFGTAGNSTALHVAAWRMRPSTLKLLIARGAAVNAVDGRGRTPLALAVRACVDSYWAERRTPESVEALLDAGASLDGVKYPSGYAEVDALLAQYGARS